MHDPTDWAPEIQIATDVLIGGDHTAWTSVPVDNSIGTSLTPALLMKATRRAAAGQTASRRRYLSATTTLSSAVHTRTLATPKVGHTARSARWSILMTDSSAPLGVQAHSLGA